MKTKKFITILLAGLLSLSCFCFVACDEENDDKNNTTSNSYNGDYDNLYDDDEWTDNH